MVSIGFFTYLFFVASWRLFGFECVIKADSDLMQEGWCDSVGSVEEIQAKLLKRQEAAAKRERAMAYALAHQVKIKSF